MWLELPSLNLDLNIHAGGELYPLEGVDGLGCVLDDVEEALVDPHLEVLAAVLVLVGAADHRVAVLLGGQGYRAADFGLGAHDSFDDLLGRLVQDLVIVGLQADTDPLLGAVSHGRTRGRSCEHSRV